MRRKRIRKISQQWSKRMRCPTSWWLIPSTTSMTRARRRTNEGDVFPGHLQEGKLKYLKKMYRAVPEMFYTKTRTTPVTPRNARSWARARRGSKPHFWGMVLWQWQTITTLPSIRSQRDVSCGLPLWLGPWMPRTPTTAFGGWTHRWRAEGEVLQPFMQTLVDLLHQKRLGDHEQGAQGREAHNRLHQEGHLEEKRRRSQVPAGTTVVFSTYGSIYEIYLLTFIEPTNVALGHRMSWRTLS